MGGKGSGGARKGTGAKFKGNIRCTFSISAKSKEQLKELSKKLEISQSEIIEDLIEMLYNDKKYTILEDRENR